MKSTTLGAERRAKLAAAMTANNLEVLIAYGNAWQGDYLMYVSDFPILEGHGLALLTPDGKCRLYLDSATEIDRATAETAGIEVRFSQQIGRDVAADLKARGKIRTAAAPLAIRAVCADRKHARHDRGRHRDRRPVPDAQDAGRSRARSQSRANRRRRVRDLPSGGTGGSQTVRSRGRNRSLAAGARRGRQLHADRFGRHRHLQRDAAVEPQARRRATTSSPS